MPFEETREQQQMYNLFRSCIYICLIIELIMNVPVGSENPMARQFMEIISAIGIFNSVASSKITEFICILITCIGTTAKKSLNFSMKRMVIYPIIIGAGLTFLCFVFHSLKDPGIPYSAVSPMGIAYAVCSVLGTVLIHQGLDAIAKYYKNEMDNDRFNYENESFPQSGTLDDNKYSVNIPMIYYFQKRMHKGWINIINPFRGTIVCGTPGSGKSFGIIDPFIRQHSAKGFAMMVYDYKFPTLAKELLYQYLKNKVVGKLPNNCDFHIINFSDVEYSSRINPIQKKYIPDLAAASETAATLLAALNKGDGGKKGGSEAFFTNSAENFLAAIIYFFVNYKPVAWKNGKKLNHFIHFRGRNLKVVIKRFTEVVAVNPADPTDEVLSFRDLDERNVAIDEDGMFVPLEGLEYVDIKGGFGKVRIEKEWYEDDDGNVAEPDTISGQYSDMPHVLSLLGKGYAEVFEILMMDDKIASLMAPFESAFKNKAMEQLEGMVGTLRVNSARLVSPEAYWVFSGDDFDLKISDPDHPSYLVIANDPEKEQIMGSLNALILNRLITKVNSKGNLPVSIIVDELPTLYFHKIDRLIGTARSNKVAVTLGFQELPQLEADYGKNGMQKIITTCGNVFMGAARNKETLEWAQNDIFGKSKQFSHSISINDTKISTSISERMDYLVPASKIADMATGWLAGQAARDFNPTEKKMFSKFEIADSRDFKTTKYFCKTHFNMEAIAREEARYVDIPKIYEFKSVRDREAILNRNFRRINKEVDDMISELLPDA